MTYEILDGGRAIKCLKCGMVSHNPNDVEKRYCGMCHNFHSDFDFVFHHTQYAVGFSIPNELPPSTPPRISLRPGRNWSARLHCRLRGHQVLVYGQCPRCELIVDWNRYDRWILERFGQAARYLEECIIRDAFGYGR